MRTLPARVHSLVIVPRARLHLRQYSSTSPLSPTYHTLTPLSLPIATPFSFPHHPILFPRSHFTSSIPAITQWFHPPNPSSSSIWTLSPTLLSLCDSHPNLLVPIEATFTQAQLHNTHDPTLTSSFTQTHLPLPLFLTYLTSPRPSTLPSLYLAQYPLQPKHPLRPFLLTKPTNTPPSIIPANQSSDPTLWLGSATSSTTPLHTDPRGNIFIQLAGTKTFRLFPPETGFEVLPLLLGSKPEGKGIRGVGMEEDRMSGENRRVVDEWVWSSDVTPSGNQDSPSTTSESEGKIIGYEINVTSGDGIFIPKGWWHAVRGVREVDESIGVEGVCASVNWWF